MSNSHGRILTPSPFPPSPLPLPQFISLEELKQRCSGFAFDGQYICEKVPVELLKLMGGKLAWRTFQWDRAHQVELALNDVRMDKTADITLRTVEWYKPSAEDLSYLVNSFQYGKGFEEAGIIAGELSLALHNPAKICDTRFVQSELKVIKSLLHNFPIYVRWYEIASSIPAGATKGKSKKPRETRNAEEKAKLLMFHKLKDMMFIGRLLILQDILQLFMTFSLMTQKVNVLPWELREAEDELMSQLKIMFETADASPEAEDRRRSAGEDGAASLLPKYFPLLYKDDVWSEFTQGRYKGVELTLPFLSEEGEQEEAGGEESRMTPAACARWLIDEGHDFIRAAHCFMRIRFIDSKGAPRQGENSSGHQYEAVGGKEARQLIATMGKCFDLRKLCAQPHSSAENVTALGAIHAAAIDSEVDMPSLPTLEGQHELLCSRLFAAASTPQYRKLWFHGASIRSGTVIMKSLFTDPALYAGLGDILWVFEQCALKTCNEAVVEGMGSIVTLHADSRRGLNAEAIEKEAFIHFNGPPLARADGLIKEALDLHFKGKDWHFTQVSVNGQKSPFSVESQVMRRLKATRPKLPFLGD